MLRPVRPDDFEAVEAAREHPETREWVNGLPEADGEAFVRFLEDGRRAGQLVYHVIVGSDDDYLGEIILFVRAEQAAELGIGEIAYVIAPAARGRGIAGKAVRLLSEWAFEQLGLERLQLSIHPENIASRRVAEKSGYLYEGTLRGIKVIRGRRIDGCSYSLLRTDLRLSARVDTVPPP